MCDASIVDIDACCLVVVDCALDTVQVAIYSSNVK